MSVVEDLKTAREYVARGWCQGAIGDSLGRVCAMGAVSLAAGMPLGTQIDHSGTEWERHMAQYDELMKHIPQEYFDVAQFNDDPRTTRQDVLDLFDKALANLGGMAAA